MVARTGDLVSEQSKARADRPRTRLFRKYILLFVAAIGTAVVAGGALEIWFGYRDQVLSQERLQEATAAGAASAIQGFMADIESQLGWATHLPWSDPELVEQRRLDGLRLLRQVPAISELRLVNPDGLEQLRLSRFAMDVVGSNLDLSGNPAFASAIAGNSYYGPVYYRRGSEPYLTLSIGGSRRDNGVAIAEVNLTFIWDLVSAIEVGEGGVAYVVDRGGNLVAHPDISLVLRNTNLSAVRQVDEALALDDDDAAHAIAGDGHIVAAATISSVGWVVIAELPLKEALIPIYRSLARTGGLLAFGILLAVTAAFFFTGRMVGPIRELELGAAEIGAGNLSKRIAIETGDELESLADRFNEMAARLAEARAGLERRVAARTEELAEKTKQLEAASSHKSQFLANMSHELRTPLNAILGFGELLLDDIYGVLNDRARQAVARMQANGDHLLGLINDVLDLSKIEAGELNLSISTYSLSDVIGSVVASAEPLASAKGLSLSQTIDLPRPLGTGDERRIRQVLLNIVGNAVKFTKAGSVRITASNVRDDFVVSVADTGPGIARQDFEMIFGEFRQVQSAGNSEGTGLGLSISRHIIEVHGGRIDLQSVLGTGSTFTVVFPIMVGGVTTESARPFQARG
jgi:signal transduction histidine kinase